MSYVETAVAAEVFNVSLSALKEASRRHSSKYPFIRLQNVGARSRGGAKLLFEVSIADIDAAIKRGKIDKNINVWLSDTASENGVKQMKFSDVKGRDLGTQDVKEQKDGLDEPGGSSYAMLSPADKSKASEKIKILKEWEEAKKSNVPSKKFCESFGVSEANLFRWQRAYKAGGAVALVDNRGKHRKSESKLEPWMSEFVLDKFRAYGAGGLNVAQLWRDLHKEYFYRHGEPHNYPKFLCGTIKPLFDAGVVKRYLDNYYADPARRLEYVMITKGEDKAKSYFQPAMGDQGEIITRRNQCWQIDSSPLDVMVRDGEKGEAIRANVLSIVDVYSGRCVASIERKSNALGLIRLMWKALSKFGKPDFIKGDNGKDYLSDQFQHLLNGLGIDYDRAIAYSGDEKGFVERHFGTLQHGGISQTPGYIGFNLAMREAVEQRTPKKERHAKDENGLPKKTNLKYLLTLQQVRDRFETEVLSWDLMSVGRKRNSPINRWNADDTPLKGVRLDEFMLHAGGLERRVVGKKGINYEAMQFVSQFLPSVGTEVFISENIDDVSSVFVFDKSGNFICEAKDKNICPMSAEMYKMVKKVFKDEMKAIRSVIKRAEFSEFTRLNVDYDLEVMLAAHKEALKPENFVYEDNDQVKAVKETIKTQKEINEISAKAFNYESLEVSVAKQRAKFSLDDAIEMASGE
ncbi:DDE-type integrase/transposase/recombinase [uncultured Campylobacter sp.]|uniref:DDE-type integrase/transposase/recombinase n=1 Tax=uncultured Campylobacter sp. TaxID=218934 RepID=UPI00262A724D|nr:DDE-type integrase/transposase/recombinase [uncultured Campylobacter sp.]